MKDFPSAWRSAPTAKRSPWRLDGHDVGEDGVDLLLHTVGGQMTLRAGGFEDLISTLDLSPDDNSLAVGLAGQPPKDSGNPFAALAKRIGLGLVNQMATSWCGPSSSWRP